MALYHMQTKHYLSGLARLKVRVLDKSNFFYNFKKQANLSNFSTLTFTDGRALCGLISHDMNSDYYCYLIRGNMSAKSSILKNSGFNLSPDLGSIL